METTSFCHNFFKIIICVCMYSYAYICIYTLYIERFSLYVQCIFATFVPIYFIFCDHEHRDLMITFSKWLFHDYSLSATFCNLLARLHLCHFYFSWVDNDTMSEVISLSSEIMFTSFHTVFLHLMHSG